jgi:hypothetical protein
MYSKRYPSLMARYRIQIIVLPSSLQPSLMLETDKGKGKGKGKGKVHPRIGHEGPGGVEV